MKISIARLTLFLRLILCFATCQASRAAVTIVDTFDQGGFSISLPEGNDNDEDVNLPLAQRRIASYMVGSGLDLREQSRAIDSTAGTFSYAVVGVSTNPNFPHGIGLSYTGGPYSIVGCTEFILGFSELSGVGTLYISLESSDGRFGAQRVDLTGPGEVSFPVSQVFVTPGTSLDSFRGLNFIFEARSEEFSFTLDDIRLIPEPSAALLALATGAGLLARRRRARL